MSAAITPFSERGYTEQIVRRRRSLFSPLSLLVWFVCLVLSLTDQWLLGPSLLVLYLGWQYLRRPGRPPVVAAAFTYQWLQVTIALFYFAVTNRRIHELELIDPQPIVLIGLASIVCFFGGYALVSGIYKNTPDDSNEETQHLSLTFVTASYVTTVAVSQLLLRIAWTIPAITQLLFVLSFARYALLYLLVTRLLSPKPRWMLILLVLVGELGMGFSGYFASFRDSLAFIGLAFLTSTTRRRGASMIAVVALIAVALVTATAWTAIKPILRKNYSDASTMADRLQRVSDALIPALENPTVPWSKQVDKFVSRMWQVYYPALAVRRVPKIIPHENGKIIGAAVSNVLKPRIFFPDKGAIASESDLVIKYAGVRVAGRESKTSMAFGYAAESYVDFGFPLMLVPIALFGCLLGVGDRLLYRYLTSWDVIQSVRVVVLWSAMSVFESSWVIMIGVSLSLFIALGLVAIGFERMFHLTPRGGSAVHLAPS